MRTLIIGDIHGCYEELQSLIALAEIGPQDQIIAIGDLIDRGPMPLQVLEYFQNTPNARTIRGNHEEKHLRVADGDVQPALSQLITRWQLGDSYAAALDYMKGMPLYIELPEVLLVHGYFEPEVPLKQQQRRVLLGTVSGESYLKDAYPTVWFERYTGDKPIIVGHRDYSQSEKPFIYNDRVWGLDTRCVYGGALTGLLLPEWRLLRVPARTNHWSRLRATYSE